MPAPKPVLYLITFRSFTPEVGEVLARIQRGEFPRPRTLRPTVPAALESICLRAMALRPGERYAKALDLAADGERWLADEPTTAFREAWPHRLGPSRQVPVPHRQEPPSLRASALRQSARPSRASDAE